jgi:hypothetical protein
MKEIKNYLHLYPNIPIVITEYGAFESTGCTLEGYDWVLDKAITERVNYDPSLIKPILRFLNSMTGDEGLELGTKIYHSIYTSGVITLSQIHYDSDINKIGFSFRDEENDLVGLTIEVDRGIDFSVNSSKLIVNQFEWTLWLLNKGFDLFELIDEDLAISTN